MLIEDSNHASYSFRERNSVCYSLCCVEDSLPIINYSLLILAGNS
jgi:hypothetical protein